MPTIFKDPNANAIFIEDSNGVQFPNSLQATDIGDNITVTDLARNIEIETETHYSEFVDQSGASYGNNAIEVRDALNTVFQAAGTPTGNAPTITSPLTIALYQGQTINYELTANFGVGYEWDFSSVPGVVNVEGNARRIIGGSSLSVGTYNIPVKAINYNGEDSETIVLTVSTPPFSNTKSVRFQNQDWAGANAGQVEPVLGRSSNGSGSSDAWTIAFWYKASTDNQGQTIVYFGNQDVTNQGFIELRQVNTTGGKRLRLRYGSNNNYIQLSSPVGSLTPGTWQHIAITYDGGTTGSSSGSINNYYSRFGVYIDGSAQTTTNTHSNFGWSGSIVGQNWRVGRFASGSHMRNANIDELALFDSDQTANIATLSASPFDLMTLTTQPKHWWRWGDANDSFPNMQDYGSQANCIFVLNNMTAANIVSDVPS